jgi:hypothetical protein
MAVGTLRANRPRTRDKRQACQDECQVSRAHSCSPQIAVCPGRLSGSKSLEVSRMTTTTMILCLSYYIDSNQLVICFVKYLLKESLCHLKTAIYHCTCLGAGTKYGPCPLLRLLSFLLILSLCPIARTPFWLQITLHETSLPPDKKICI